MFKALIEKSMSVNDMEKIISGEIRRSASGYKFFSICNMTGWVEVHPVDFPDNKRSVHNCITLGRLCSCSKQSYNELLSWENCENPREFNLEDPRPFTLAIDFGKR